MPTPPDRLPVVDALRGFALFGILVVNLYGYALPLGTDPTDVAQGPLDHAADFITNALFESKFYVLFSFLFGFGLAMQIERARPAPERLRARYLRRMAGLFVLGALHATLLFAGDILVSYALLGLVLWRLRGWEDWRLERFAIGMLGVACVLGVVIGTSFALAPDEGSLSEPAPPPAAPGIVAPGQNPLTGPLPTPSVPEEAQSDFRSSFEQRLEDLKLIYLFAPLATWPGALAMFVFGLLAGRTGALSSRAGLLELAHMRWGAIVAIAVVGNLLYAVCGRSTHPLLTALAFGVLPLAGPLLALIYAQLLWAYVERRPQAWLTRALQAAGRLSLSNYLGQSLVCALLFEGYGLGLHERLGPAALMGLAVVLFAMQLAVSMAWLRCFRLGPAEWLLRRVTYGRAFRAST